MHVHLVGACGAGMSSLGALLRAQGHRVTGSDARFEPPASDVLAAAGVETLAPGFSPERLDSRPDLVVVGNVCRPDNPEAAAARLRGLRVVSMAGAVADRFLLGRRSLVVAGTHGKSTTTALVAHLLHACGRDPSFLVGGIARNFDASAHLGTGGEFVIEGDEYDSAFFEKTPKFWQYRPDAAILTSIEFDHADIYRDDAAYLAAFAGFVERVPAGGPLVVAADCPSGIELARGARARLVTYGVHGDPAAATADYTIRDLGVPSEPGRLFSLQRRDEPAIERSSWSLFGRHNLANLAAALALCHEALGIDPVDLAVAARSFRGVRRRQEQISDTNGIRIYDDFAHHPTAVRVTLEAFRETFPKSRLVCAFEPRSATACRRIHQDAYARAFLAADVVALAPVARPEIPPADRLDTTAIAEALRARGKVALAATSIAALESFLHAELRSGDVVVLLSNGTFGGLVARLSIPPTRTSVRRSR